MPATLPRLFLLAFIGVVASASAQSRLREHPEWARYEKVRDQGGRALKSGAVAVTWIDGGKALTFEWDGRQKRCDLEKRAVEDLGPAKVAAPAPLAAVDRAREQREWRDRPDRGRQFPAVPSPDGAMVAWHQGRNLHVGATAGGEHRAVTTDADDRNRLRYGSASWTYGEEFFQKSAIWWSPEGRRLAFYRFDESRVPDFYLARDLTARHSTLEIEPYTKAGGPNPQVDVVVHDLDTRRSVTIDVRSGKPFADDVPGHYVFAVRWAPDGRELLFHRMDRRQKVLELCAADPASGSVRVVYHESWPASWVDPESATLHFLRDGRRFLRESERSGWRNLVRHDLAGGEPVAVTSHQQETAGIVRVDEAAGTIHYLARSGEHPAKLQLHRCRLDGSADVRLTDPARHHAVDIAPDGRHFVDVSQTHDEPPVTRVLDADGRVVADLAASDLKGWEPLGLRRVERFAFKAADGTTDLHGLLHHPPQFNAGRKWPLLVHVYAGPGTSGVRGTFMSPSPMTAPGFLVATFDARSAPGYGKKAMDAIYQRLGIAEVDDIAAGIRALAARSFVDPRRVGIHGTSYGGMVSAMAILRHPDVFQAACTSSGVMDFRNYDSIYTERYLGLPGEAAAAYDAASPLPLAPKLTGRLMIFFGTADNNVHLNNSLQLIKALQDTGRSFDVQVGPDAGHVSINQERLLEFFCDSLGSGPR